MTDLLDVDDLLNGRNYSFEEELLPQRTPKLSSQPQQFCTFFLDGHYFGVPVQQIREVLRYQEMTDVPLVSNVIRGIINPRGQIIIAVDLRRQFGMSDRPEKQTIASPARLPLRLKSRTLRPTKWPEI